ncbi:MAG TPA: diguanylate cyclase [Thermoleophilaceae bacterium]|nr:diguanylate cyclase [Thermoleophilaceae bacterium]
MGHETHDDFETQFWLNTVTAGAWITVLMCVAGGAYTVFFVEAPDRLAVGASIVVTAIGGVIVRWGIPWRSLIGSRWRELAFGTWTALTIVLIATSAALDGGATSPLALMLFLPVVFASLAYPLRLVLTSALLAVAAFLALVLVAAPSTAYVAAFCLALAGTALMALWQAANHDGWRHELARSSRTDPLTGLLNRRGFAAASEAAFSALERHGRPVTLVVLDLDLFKAYNDTRGHQAGDELLCWVAGRLEGEMRPSDAVARLGGDEFAVLLPDTGQAVAERVIARLRAALEPRARHCLGRASAPEQGTTFDSLYRIADTDMYQRKLLRLADPLDEESTEAAFEHRKRSRALSADDVLAGITDAFFALDGQWRFVYVNEPAERLLEQPAHELLGRSIWSQFPEAVGSRFDRIYRHVASTGQPQLFAERYGPLERTFSVKASPLNDGISVYFHDVSGEPETRTSAVDPAAAGA